MNFKPLMETTRFHDLLCEGKLTRRQAQKVAASYGVGAVTMSTIAGFASAAPEDQPVFFTWNGYDSPEFMGQYIEEHGEPPRFALFDNEDGAFQKMRAGFVPDVMFPCSASMKLWYDAGFLAPIDTSRLSNWEYVLDVFKDAPNTVINGERIYVPSDWGQTSIIIRTDLAPEYKDPENQSWTALWDEKYAGRIAMTDYSYIIFAITALVQGYAPWDMTNEQMEDCADRLRAQMPMNRVITDSGTELAQVLASGEVVMAVAENGLIWQLQEAVEGTGAEWTWIVPKEGALTWHCGQSIHPAAMENGMYEKAHDVIDSMISKEAGVYEIGDWNYGHSNRLAYDEFTDEFLESIALSRNVDAFLKGTAFVEEMNDIKRITELWESVKAGF
jgi:spermidine/putrescine transport system substrate-binding protein